MEHRISDLLDCLEDAGQDLKPRGGNTARVRARTFAKLHEAKAPSVSRRSLRPLRILVAAAAAVLLLCGSVFAAWKLGAFRFSEVMGPEGEILDQWAVNYDPENTQPVAADNGYERQEHPGEYTPKIATAAETKDYRFSLRTLAASESVLYAVVDVEGLSDYGLAHLDVIPEIALSNRTHPGSSALLDARLMESGDGVRRYMVGLSRNADVNAEGDIIVFELLELMEEGDMTGHPYHLFDVELEQLVPKAVPTDAPTGTPKSGTQWDDLELDALGLTLKGSVDREAPWPPVVTLVFRDGTQEIVLDEDNSFYGQQAPMPEGHRAILTNAGGHRDGPDYLSLIFARPVDIDDLAAVEIDGQTFSLKH